MCNTFAEGEMVFLKPSRLFNSLTEKETQQRIAEDLPDENAFLVAEVDTDRDLIRLKTADGTVVNTPDGHCWRLDPKYFERALGL